MSGNTCDIGALQTKDMDRLTVSFLKAMAKNPLEVGRVVKGALNKDVISSIMSLITDNISDWGSRELTETLRESFEPGIVACFEKGPRSAQQCKRTIRERFKDNLTADVVLSSVDSDFRACLTDSASPQCKLFFSDLSFGIFRGSAVYIFGVSLVIIAMIWFTNKYLL